MKCSNATLLKIQLAILLGLLASALTLIGCANKRYVPPAIQSDPKGTNEAADVLLSTNTDVIAKAAETAMAVSPTTQLAVISTANNSNKNVVLPLIKKENIEQQNAVNAERIGRAHDASEAKKAFDVEHGLRLKSEEENTALKGEDTRKTNDAMRTLAVFFIGAGVIAFVVGGYTGRPNFYTAGVALIGGGILVMTLQAIRPWLIPLAGCEAGILLVVSVYEAVEWEKRHQASIKAAAEKAAADLAAANAAHAETQAALVQVVKTAELSKAMAGPVTSAKAAISTAGNAIQNAVTRARVAAIRAGMGPAITPMA